jgi:hypothetical protein
MLFSAAVALLQTALFHINPIKLDYNRFDYKECVIYAKAASVDEEYEQVAAALMHNELSHGLHYKKKIQLILCESQREISRYLPLANRSEKLNAGAFAPWPNTVYITPKIRSKYGRLQPVLEHELSHILLLQHYGLIRCTILWKKFEWIPEGYAIFLSKWPIYFEKEELAKNLDKAGIAIGNGSLLGRKRQTDVPLPLRFMIYYYFIDHIHHMDTGNLNSTRFLREACINPKNVEKLFQSTFGESISESIDSFAASISEK